MDLKAKKKSKDKEKGLNIFNSLGQKFKGYFTGDKKKGTESSESEEITDKKPEK